VFVSQSIVIAEKGDLGGLFLDTIDNRVSAEDVGTIEGEFPSQEASFHRGA
jgi:hypothetical protein